MMTTEQQENAQYLANKLQQEFGEKSSQETEVDNRRQFPRHALMRRVVALSATMDGTLYETERIEGQTWNVSAGGLSLELKGRSQFEQGPLIVGVAGPDQSLQYAGVLVRHVGNTEANRVQLGVEFSGPTHQVLEPDNLVPVFQSDSLKIEFNLPERVYQSWERAGILKKYLADRIQVCSRCGAIPTLREGCPACHGGRGACDRLIHHFACAHVASVTEFETDECITCPKCRSKQLVVGADFEFLQGPYNCVDCGTSSTSLESISHCMGCHHRCPASQLSQIEIWAYHVPRFDPLDFIPE